MEGVRQVNTYSISSKKKKKMKLCSMLLIVHMFILFSLWALG